MFFLCSYGKMVMDGIFMSIFRKRHKIEEIDIVLKEEPALEEVKEEVKKKPVFTDSIEEALGLINKKYKGLAKGIDNLVYNYYICKFFALAVFKKVDEYEELASLEKQLNNLRNSFYEISNKVDKLNEQKDYIISYLEELYDSIVELQYNITGLEIRVNETRREKFNSLRVSSLAVLLNKTGEELERMDKRFTAFTNDFKSLEEVSDYIYVNSGEAVTNLVNSLVRCIQSTNKEEYKKQFDLYYFLKSDVIICLELSEWIELYNKIKHCTNVLRNVDIANYIDFESYLEEFEIRYLTLMINEERKNYIRGDKNEKIN